MKGKASAGATLAPIAQGGVGSPLFGLDICTDGDAHYDEEVGGMSWQAIRCGTWRDFDAVAEPGTYNVGGVALTRGHILHDYLEARVFPKIVGSVGAGNLMR